MKSIRKAVFPAAGLGTRFLPATKAQPKEMLPLVDKPIIQYGVEEACSRLRPDHHRHRSRQERHRRPLRRQLRTGENAGRARQERTALHRAPDFRHDPRRLHAPEGSLGLGHAVLMARELVGDEPFAVCSLTTSSMQRNLASSRWLRSSKRLGAR